jgi:hypothetical protein
LIEAVRDENTFWESTLKYPAQEKEKPHTKKPKTESGSAEEHQ